MDAKSYLALGVNLLLCIAVLGGFFVGIRAAIGVPPPRAAEEPKNSARAPIVSFILVVIAIAFVYATYAHNSVETQEVELEIFEAIRTVAPLLAVLFSAYYFLRVNAKSAEPILSRKVSEKLQSIWRSFVVALPLWLIVISVLLFYLGYLEDIKGRVTLQKLFYTVASAVLSGGVFAAVLKAMQFMNIFQDSVEKIIVFDKDWLSTLTDSKLRDIWRNVVAATVAKGFPQLSQRLGDDVFDHVLPKLGGFYYSKMFRRLELVSYDPETDFLVIDEQYELIINVHSKDLEIPYDFRLEAPWPQALQDRPYQVNSFTIDGKNHIGDVEFEGKCGDSEVVLKYKIPLLGRQRYSVHRNMRRTHRLSSDPILHMVGKRFTESMILSLDNRVSEHLRVRPIAIGIADGGVEFSRPEPHLLRCEVTHLMFPGDGLLLVLERI